jgi:hypothetical protein
MKKTFAYPAFAVAAALLMITASGCSTTPVAQDPVATELPATADSVSSTTIADPTGGSAPEAAPAQDSMPAPVAEAPSSLGASSSGRGH